MRWAWARVDLGALEHNVRVVRDLVAPSEVWAVVKADGYGHGALQTARAALAAGATGLCVALTQEGAELRAGGIGAPILVLSEQPPEDAARIVAERLTPTVYTPGGIAAIAAAAAASSGADPVVVHLKIDTGMHRVGAQPSQALALADAIVAAGLSLAGLFTHLASADEPAAGSNASQLATFDDVVTRLAAAGHAPALLHAANSAAALAIGGSRRDIVRLGIAMYGIEPGPAVSALCAELRPALSLRARVSLVKQVAAGEGVSYGLRHHFTEATTVATIPIGYADGVPRRLFASGCEVLIHGRRMPVVGVITMDQLMVDCGDATVEVGDEVVLIGSQAGSLGSDTIRAEEWAARLGTIGYEIVCGISKRIERRFG